ncbi:RecF/RecN/SMC N terminal domain-containing protein [Colletotrichum abscissum]|uniref:RecF/RecN/SMC N terminal domain-containing protein n=1 Tax=Colletotrichum abscissum TaxID=1671311 RepID=UPI0027D6CC16|nr:RecF/RecN/SMC N terminal domain-containing protein [Colletotrichum abscissum]KAK1495633.1 RecF/RecN/SMC N terminal domain-containing protein [Colletotrichum abscissum]
MGKLIRLELFNFKSYKGHHILLFGDSYFTSIIGPNGSGKSNSMDAISFVLGIKSSHLRSAHLKDLVYRGRVLKTSKINDDGSAEANGSNGHSNGDGDELSQKASRTDPKTAWVMAVYEDDAGDEQKWKRSITNQGSSEYRINDRVVTAQQYNEALESENILIKARNFLVFQGDVEAIAAQSPQDLTRLIEQISGSLEYKAEYERLQTEAEQAAENQSFQLHRRRGINSEIKQYQEQKKEADNFQKKTDERDEAIVKHALWKLYHFQRGMDESTEQIHDHQQNLQEFQRNVESFRRKLEVAQKEQQAAAKDVNGVEKAINAKKREFDELEHRLIPIDAKIEEKTRNIEQGRSRMEPVRKERDKQAEVIKEDEARLKTTEKAQQHFEKQLKERMKKLGKELSDDDRKEYNSLRSQVVQKVAGNQGKLDNLIRQQKTDEVTVNTLKGKVDTLSAALEKYEGELETLGERKSSTEGNIKALSQEIDTKKKQYHQIQSERVRTSQRRTELEEKLETVAKQLREADDGRRQNDREARMKEMVNNLKRLYPGVKGRIGDLCKPKQKKFDEAVGIALGRDFDSVIVDTEKTGHECVQYLKDQRFPPMTFIPLDNIKVNAVNSAIKGISGARLTIDTIDFDAAYERAMAYACGSSVVCDNEKIAKVISYEKRIPVKTVTLDGLVIHKTGMMTGGRGPQDKGGKRRFENTDLEPLKKMAAKYKEEIEKLPKSGRRSAAEESLQIEIHGLEPRLAAAKAELAHLEKNYNSKKRERDNEERQLDELDPKYEEKKAELEATKRTVKEFSDAIAQVEDEVFSDFCRRLGFSDIRAYETEHRDMQREADEERTKFEVQKSRFQSQLTLARDMHSNLEKRLRKLQETLKGAERDLQSYQREKSDIEDSSHEISDELDALSETLEEYRGKLEEKSQKVSQAKAEVHKRSKEIDARQKEINALETVVQKNSAGKFALLRRCKLDQIQVPLLEGSLDNLPNEDNMLRQDADAMDVDEEVDDEDMMTAALENHGIEIDYDALDEEMKTSDDASVEEKLQDKIASLASELEKLNPNMRAIERLESVESRLKNTEKEFEDSRAALKAARDAFNHVKAQRYELFNKAFTHIQEQISHVYKDLTRSEAYPLGGQAYLDIEEDTDTPYLSGIKYHAMPPLKRFRDMEHLSGGEKTMAALALLFAIHSYQPSPFFVLDEVDAALDNANVDKIKKYIREHAGPGMQFIVISLKTGLFQDSESLVGVYRDQEVNSSRALTLDVSPPPQPIASPSLTIKQLRKYA